MASYEFVIEPEVTRIDIGGTPLFVARDCGVTVVAWLDGDGVTHISMPDEPQEPDA